MTWSRPFAKYPRIIVDPKVFDTFKMDSRLRAHDGDLDEEIEYVQELVCQGDDGLYFIDYLRAFRMEMDDPAEFPAFLARLNEKL